MAISYKCFASRAPFTLRAFWAQSMNGRIKFEMHASVPSNCNSTSSNNVQDYSSKINLFS